MTKLSLHIGAQNDCLYVITGDAPAMNNDYPVHNVNRKAVAKVMDIDACKLIVQALNEEAQLETAEVWHAGSNSFYKARLLRKLPSSEVYNIQPKIPGPGPVFTIDLPTNKGWYLWRDPLKPVTYMAHVHDTIFSDKVMITARIFDFSGCVYEGTVAALRGFWSFVGEY